MKKTKKLLGVILSICLLIGMWNLNVYAASGSLSVGSKTATVGSTVTVTATVSGTEAISAATVSLTFDASALQMTGCSVADASIGAGSIRCVLDAVGQNKQTLSFTITFKVLKEGSFRVSGIVDAVSDVTMQPMNISGGGGTITGKAKTTTTPTNPSTPSTPSTSDNKDTNSKLTGLQVSPGTLAPAFKTDVTAYTVTVPKTTTEVTIAATAQSSKAKVTVSGGKNLKLGPNEAKVVVMAESGATTVYVLNIMCGEEEKIEIAGVDNIINESFTDDQIPAGFARAKVTYNDREYEALKMQKGELTLVNLKNDVGNTFYIFDQETQEFYNFAQITFSNGKYIIPLTLDDTKTFAGHEQISITLKDKAFDAWKLNDEYSIIRVLNSDGEVAFYQYDNVDGTLQRYAEKIVTAPVEDVEEASNFLDEYYLYIIIGLGVVVIALIIALICFALKNRNRHADEYDDYEEDSYVESVRVEPSKQLAEVEQQHEKKKRKHDARRRKAIKRLEKQRMNEDR